MPFSLRWPIGVGGYASGPVLLMAAMKNIPVVVHEPNAVPGLANRAIAPFVSRALVTFAETQRFFPVARVEIVGVPVRPEFLHRAAENPPAAVHHPDLRGQPGRASHQPSCAGQPAAVL